LNIFKKLLEQKTRDVEVISKLLKQENEIVKLFKKVQKPCDNDEEFKLNIYEIIDEMSTYKDLDSYLVCTFIKTLLSAIEFKDYQTNIYTKNNLDNVYKVLNDKEIVEPKELCKKYVEAVCENYNDLGELSKIEAQSSFLLKCGVLDDLEVKIFG